MYPFSTKMREALGNLEGEEDGFPNTSWVLVESWVLVDILLTTNPSPSECDGSENESNPSLLMMKCLNQVLSASDTVNFGVELTPMKRYSSSKKSRT